MASFKHSLIFLLALILRIIIYWALICLLVICLLVIYKCLKYAFRKCLKCARGNGEDPTCEYYDLGSDPF